MKKVLLSSLFLPFLACQAPQNKTSSPPQWTYTVQNLAPREAGGEWKRVVQIHGNDVEGKDVDRQAEGDENWIYVGETDEQGRFIDTVVNQRVRYRVGNILVTPWIDAARDVMIDERTSLPAKISGARCIVPESTKLYLADKTLELDCDEIHILGTLQSYKNLKASTILPDQSGENGLNAGVLILRAEHIEVQGNIWIIGQEGADGKSYPPTSVRVDRIGSIGGHGGKGGDGGNIHISTPDLEAYGEIKFNAGAGGHGGKGSAITASNGQVVTLRPDGANGADGKAGHFYRE